ncbi:MAG: flagellar hook-basal body protein [Armatimonadota bacterium]|nr:flagellar hook-basal body protein [Armatimonadota bacterium]
MIRALYTAASGLVAEANKQDVIANNIANAQTPGFKRERVTKVSFAEVFRRQVAFGKSKDLESYPSSAVEPVLTTLDQSVDMSQGSIRPTDNPLDLAIDGPGFFEVAYPDGVRYTRAGNFTLNSQRELCTLDGAKVQGSAGSIRLPNGAIEIYSDGSILVNGQQVDRLRIVGASQGKTRVISGALEESNVSVVKELADMIVNMRSFEANQRVVTSVDHTLDKLINEAGRV